MARVKVKETATIIKMKDIKGLLQTAGTMEPKKEDVVSTGIVTLDVALKYGGYRRARTVEIMAPEHSGKTLSTMLAIKSDQLSTGRKSLFVDAEGSFDPIWFKNLGGIPELLDVFDPMDLLKTAPKSDVWAGEEVYDAVVEIIKNNEYTYAVLDSYMAPTLASKKLLGIPLSQQAQMGIQPMLNKGFLQRSAIVQRKVDTTLLITNHLMEKIGVVFGNPETTSGGKYLKFIAEQRIKWKQPKDKITGEGHLVRGVVVKNKRGNTAGYEFDFWLDYNKGVDNNAEMIKLLLKHDLIETKNENKILKEISNEPASFEKFKQQLMAVVGTGKDEIEHEEEL